MSRMGSGRDGGAEGVVGLWNVKEEEGGEGGMEGGT